MSWQRIDENTYIDDTLITCIEYQLFIDAMREQGKYYQPDHWTSYQFPKGQGREPVLGVRHADALTFCEWLTKRETGDWEYRLPKRDEVATFPINALKVNPAGYWLSEIYQFMWIGSIPEDPRGITNQFNSMIEGAVFIARYQDLYQDLKFRRTFIRDDDLRLQFDLELAHNLLLDRGIDLDNDHDSASIIARDMNRAYGFADAYYLARARDPAHTIEPDHAFDRSRALNLTRALDIDRTFDHFHDLDHVRNRALDSTFDRDRALESALSLSFGFSFVSDQTNPLELDIYIDCYTLQLRIAGRSPAFEGIRLVKEWIK